MIIGITGNIPEMSCIFRFDNGWAAVVSLPKECGHSAINIVPTWLFDDVPHAQREIMKNRDYWNINEMKRRGDFIECVEGGDAGLLAIIKTVSERGQEPHLAKVSQDIIKAVKS